MASNISTVRVVALYVAMHLEGAGTIFHKKKHFTQLCHTPQTTLAKLDQI